MVASCHVHPIHDLTEQRVGGLVSGSVFVQLVPLCVWILGNVGSRERVSRPCPHILSFSLFQGLGCSAFLLPLGADERTQLLRFRLWGTSFFPSFLATQGTAPLTRTLGRATWLLVWMKVYLVFALERSEGLWFPLTSAMERKEEVSAGSSQTVRASWEPKCGSWSPTKDLNVQIALVSRDGLFFPLVSAAHIPLRKFLDLRQSWKNCEMKS